MGYIGYALFNAFLYTGMMYEPILVFGFVGMALSSPAIGGLLLIVYQKPTIATKSLLSVGKFITMFSPS